MAVVDVIASRGPRNRRAQRYRAGERCGRGAGAFPVDEAAPPPRRSSDRLRPMEHRRLGRGGVKVSRVVLGSWLTFGSSVDASGTAACVKAALESGITTFDTADVYALGKAEEVLGKALAGVPRKDYVLATKVFWPTGDGPNDRGPPR